MSRTPESTSDAIDTGPLLAVDELVEWHAAAVDAWHADPVAAGRLPAEAPPAVGRGSGALERAVAEEHLVNIRLWHEEDEARRPDVDDAVIAGTKRRIDALNQERNDLIEAIDDALLDLLTGGVPLGGDAPLHSETPGAIVDRLSILALKVYHMREEAERDEADAEHRRRCRDRLEVLTEQRADLAACLTGLLAEIAAGRRRFRRYRQFKMYNDPETNPAIRRARRGGDA